MCRNNTLVVLGSWANAPLVVYYDDREMPLNDKLVSPRMGKFPILLHNKVEWALTYFVHSLANADNLASHVNYKSEFYANFDKIATSWNELFKLLDIPAICPLRAM